MIECPYCKKKFSDENARYQHAKMKHKGKKVSHLRPKHEDDHESMGELAARAHWDGDSELDWVREMFDIEKPY